MISYKSKKTFLTKVKEQKELILITLPFLVLLIVFVYVPLWGWIMAFQNYKPALGVQGSEWVGLKNFSVLFKDPDFYHAIRNTLGISVLKFVTGFTGAITLAVLINEVRNVKFKKVVQTISYLPHFVSWVVAASIVTTALSPDNGIVNEVLIALHFIKEPIAFMGIPKLFWGILAGSDLWKEIGWSTIIYLAAMTAIDNELYEAASIDGAGRIRKVFAITLPSIIPTIKILMILSIGWLLTANFEQVYLLRNGMVADVSNTLEIYVYNLGIPLGRYSFATTAGIFTSVVSLILVMSCNRLSKLLDGESAF
ncbi:ABC transporter permease [Clostridium sp.]|uniref:ABC transporter permease n=1 Tax=Clostridium sp. TaxID=1506 RepID=UPI003FD83A6C